MKLPKYVTLRHGYWCYRPWDKNLKAYAPQQRLAPKEAHYAEIMDAYHRATAKSVYNLRSLISRYMESPQFNELAVVTKKNYHNCMIGIDREILSNDQSLLDIAFQQWSPALTRRYLDIRVAKTQANREVQFMRSVFSWGYERDLCPNNPCKGVRLNKTPPRTRYITDDEFKIVSDLAKPRMKAAMTIAFKCRLRQVEVRNLRRDDLTSEGISCKRHKGSKTTIVEWDHDLKAACNWSDSISTFVLHGYDCHQWKREAFTTEWPLASGLKNRFTFHDLKAKGISDDQGDKQKGSGHKSASMINIYDRLPAKVLPIHSEIYGTRAGRSRNKSK